MGLPVAVAAVLDEVSPGVLPVGVSGPAVEVVSDEGVADGDGCAGDNDAEGFGDEGATVVG
ncbi:hypothetical protein [Streptomyces sp. S3(2020)]|uniref:hypothetical protein n=1 Tax=Streptomyces sp. S3(2020) TaxID=2732044 RepID=UPI001F0F6817|nr:hypothetical protein [Streptomyces sp. S3(2020)]